MAPTLNMKTTAMILLISLALILSTAGCSTSKPKATVAPPPTAVLLNEARFFYGTGRWDEAEQKLRLVLRNEPDNRAVQELWALVLISQDERARALEWPHGSGYLPEQRYW